MTLPPCVRFHKGDRELIDLLLTPLTPGLAPHTDAEEPRSAAARGLVCSELDPDYERLPFEPVHRVAYGGAR